MSSMKHPYATKEYAHAFSNEMDNLYIPEWGVSVLIREVKSGIKDAMGIYPLTILNHDVDLEGGLKRLQSHGLVSVVFVLDDYHRPEINILKRYFNLIKPFKSHYIYNRSLGHLSYDKHHRYEIKRAFKNVTVSAFSLHQHIDEWIELYSNLISHHGISGTQAFSRNYHSALSQLDGVTSIGAWYQDKLISCHIWVNFEGYVHSHLAASSPEGYALRAAYAVNAASLDYFADSKIINLGGGAGNVNQINDGLVKFKRGFSNEVAPSYLCGAILDLQQYQSLVVNAGVHASDDFFPAYRSPSITTRGRR